MSDDSFACLYAPHMQISDAGSLTLREHKKQVKGRISFVNECEDVGGMGG
jgi:hypothetical protein